MANIPGVPFKLTAEDMGVPDYGAAIKEGLSNYILANQAKYAPQKEQMNMQKMQAEIEEKQRLAQDPFHGKIPPGVVGQGIWLSQIEKVYGKDSREAKQAREAVDNERKYKEGLNNYREALTNTAGTRSLTGFGKLEAEESDVKSGFRPGTNRTERITPEEQGELLGQYQLKRQKEASDLDTRKKVLFAKNMDYTLDNINVDDLVQYAGIGGEIQKKIGQGIALSNNESKAYEKYQTALVGANALAKQVRQFYGDSITPSVQEGLAELTNPASWRNNPKIAKAKFEQFKKLLKGETQNYMNALQSPSSYKREDVPETSIPKGAMIHVSLPGGGGGFISADKREAFLKKHPNAQFD